MRFFRKKNVDWESEAYKRARFHYLLQIIYGESLAENYCQTMSTFAPTADARDFLLQQQREEDAHLELLTDMVSHMVQPNVPISKHARKLHDRMERALIEQDWATCLMIQNFIIEGFSITLCGQQGKYGDGEIHRVFERIVRDEKNHVAFGVRELKKLIDADTDGALQKKLAGIQRRILFRSILFFKDIAPDADDLGIAWDDLGERMMREHLERIAQVGLRLPFLDRLFLQTALTFFALL
jgi:1,2-phenylacetyl-CoA epoxidase catalytic subunit